MLTTMAAKCVVTAVTIIDLLGTQSDAHIFVAWWFNIACKLREVDVTDNRYIMQDSH